MRIIAGTARSRRIDAPEGRDTRPTLDRVRENLFNMLQTRIRDSKVLDLFAGSGALSFEALSRGAAQAVLVDKDRKAHEVQKRNAVNLGFADRCEIRLSEWNRATEQMKVDGKYRFDLIFLDPPYAMTDLREVMNALVPLLEEDALIIVEHEGTKEPFVPGNFENTNRRKWGFCGVSFYQYRKQEAEDL